MILYFRRNYNWTPVRYYRLSQLSFYYRFPLIFHLRKQHLTTVNPHSMRAMAEDGNKKAAISLKIDRES